MRTFLIIFCTLVVLGGGFLAYLTFQDPPAKRPQKSLAMVTRTQRSATTTQSVHGIGSVDNPWVKRFENGELASQFRSERSEPSGGDVVQVTRPQAEFFTSDGAQRLRVEGVSGEVIVPGGGGGEAEGGGGARLQGSGGAGNMTPPSRGKLQGVEISMYEPADAVEPMLVATMPNAVFDNDTFRIATDAYTDASGKRIEADQVPVVVRGRDYDFTGRGLVIRWNQRDRRLQLLEIAHGESLTVKNLDALSMPQLAPEAPATPATAPAVLRGTQAMLASADPRAVVLAAADPPAAAAAAAPPPRAKKRRKRAAPAPVAPAGRPKVTRDLAPVVYRASFENDVKIFEGADQVVAAERMEIDILQPPQEDPATKPAGDASHATTTPTKRDRRRELDPPTAAPAPAAATTQGVKGPITVKWSGKLRVVPLENADEAGLAPGKALVRLTGAPVRITRDKMKAQAGMVSFNSADGRASLRANEVVPVVEMSLGDGSRVTTTDLSYVEMPDGRRLATLLGQSRAEMSAQGGKDPLTLTWNKQGELQLIELAPGRTAIERARFAGNVKIVHPDLDMTSETLALGFDPSRAIKAAAATTQSATTAPLGGDDAADSIREIVATGDVHCRIVEQGAGGGAARTVAAQNLRVELDRAPSGERYARLIRAEGGVRTNEGSGELEAGQLTAELAPPAPSTQPIATVDASDARQASPFGGGSSAQLVSLVARDNVRLATADGSAATADILKVQDVDGRREYLLSGEPVAMVTQKGKTQGQTNISGPAIRFAPDEQLAQVIGPGGMTGTLPDDPKESFDIAWGGGATVNGATNRIDVTKNIVIKSIQADGTINTATSAKLEATLEPTAAPATRAASTKPSQADEMNFLAGKELTAVTLTADGADRVEVKSELFDQASGALLRGLNLYARTLTTNRATRRLEIPVPGEMLVRDHRPPEPREAADGAAAAEGPTLGSGRGNTAFKWSKSLIYDDAQQQAVMTGDVKVVHHPITEDGQPFNLWADSLTAQLRPDPTAKPSTKPAEAGAQPRMRLKRVIASGNVKVESARLNVDARELRYDPVGQVLYASGDENSLITIFDKETGTSSTAGELEWNTASDQFRIKELGGKVRP